MGGVVDSDSIDFFMPKHTGTPGRSHNIGRISSTLRSARAFAGSLRAGRRPGSLGADPRGGCMVANRALERGLSGAYIGGVGD